MIVFGATFFALGMMPDLIDTFFEGMRNFRDNFSPTRGPIPIQTDSAQLWLVVGGGVMMIIGLLALVLN